MYVALAIIACFTGALVSFVAKGRARAFALIFSLVPLALFGYLYTLFGTGYTELHSWISPLGVHLNFAIDGLSMALVLLTAILFPLTIVYAWNHEQRPGLFFSLLLMLEAALIGVFTATDFIVFYICWELTLIPLYFVVGLFGGERREHAAIKFFIYTHVGSLVMLLAIFALYFASGLSTFDMHALMGAYAQLPPALRDIIFAGLLVGFIVKLPAVPLHGWLPDAYGEAPTAGTVLIAGLLSKMGAYGLLRISLPMLAVSYSVELFTTLLAVLGVGGIVYASLVALAQRDLKQMVAYSSVSHMGFVLLAVASLSAVSVSGAMFMLFSHGLIIALLFMAVGVVHERAGTRLIPELGGITHRMPVLAFLVMGGFLASLGLPGMSGFVAEFLTLTGAYTSLPTFVLAALFGVIITASYYIWAMQRAFFGPYNERLGKIVDVGATQAVPMAVLLGLVVLLGVHPAPLLGMLENVATSLVMGVLL